MSDYFIGDWEGPSRSVKRAMVSLGPLSPKRYCTYACTFCYVDGDFQQYPARTPSEVLQWLKRHQDEYNIVFVSGDTDSFARPRTSEGIALLELLTELTVDILFTTRYAFSEQEVSKLASVAKTQQRQGKLLIACGSILGTRHFIEEPRPVPSPEARLNSLKALGDAGTLPILALRPLLPSVQPVDIIQLLDRIPSTVNHVLSGWLYYNERQRSGLGIRDEKPAQVDLYFDIGGNTALEYRNQETMDALVNECSKRGLRLYVRSAPLIEDLRQDAKAKSSQAHGV